VHNSNISTFKENISGRLKKRPEFLCVASAGKKWVSDTVVIQILENDSDVIRFGFTATKKIGNAVIRNRCKRRLRAASDHILMTEKFAQGFDIVVIARDKVAKADWNKIIKDLRWCLKRLNALNKLPN